MGWAFNPYPYKNQLRDHFQLIFLHIGRGGGQKLHRKHFQKWVSVHEYELINKLREGFKKKKKNLEFSRFGLKHPPTLVIAENLEKK